MAKKVFLIIGLGAVLALITAGTASSQLSLGGVDVPSVGGVDVTTPTTTVPDVSLYDPTAPITGGGSIGGGSTGGGSTGGGSTGGGSTGGGSTDGGSSDSGYTGGSSDTSSGTTTTGGTGKAGSSTSKKGGLFAKDRKKRRARRESQKIQQPALRNPDGSPTPRNPSLTIAQFGPAPIGVPNPVIDAFEIPP